MSAEDAEEVTQALAQVFSGGYRLVWDAQRRGIPQALGLTTKQWVNDRLGGYIQMNVPERRQAVAELTDAGLSTREIAGVVGAGKSTVAEDLAAVQNRTDDPKNAGREADSDDAAVQDRTPDLPNPPEPPTPEEVKRKQRKVRDEKADVKRDQRAEREAQVTDVPEPDIREGTLSEALADVTDVDLVFTDPPYPREFLPAWAEMAEWAAGALKPGALLVAYSGQYHLPDVIERLSEHLTYQWLGWLSTTGPQVAVHQRPVMSGGKPLLVFSNGALTEPYRSRRFFDAANSEGRTRELHTWEQAEGPAAYYIDALTERGELVADPFLGSGTFACVARKLCRRFVGCDIDAAAVTSTRDRLAA